MVGKENRHAIGFQKEGVSLKIVRRATYLAKEDRGGGLHGTVPPDRGFLAVSRGLEVVIARSLRTLPDL